MNLYDIIPENLFSVLVSKNKNLYVKTLFVLLDAFKQHLKISKDELISMINAQLDDDIISADFTEEELLESEQSISGKAHFLVRKLKSTGWILIETENDFREYITVPGFSYKIIQLLYDVANVSETENFAYVYSTYSSLEIAKKTRDPFEMITALNDGAERTEHLVESLKSVYHSITYYNQQLINTLNVNNVKKAISFEPINDIEKFITENVCDIEDDIDIVSMQENILYYKQQEDMAKRFEGKLRKLEEICRQYAEIEKLRSRRKIQQFLIDYGTYNSHCLELEQAQADFKKYNDDIAEFEQKKEELEKLKNQLENEHTQLINEKAKYWSDNNGDRLKDEEKRYIQAIEDYDRSISGFVTDIKTSSIRWNVKFSNCIEKIDNERITAEIKTVISYLQRTDKFSEADFELLSPEYFSKIREAYLNAKSSLDTIERALASELKELNSKKAELEGLIVRLQKGIKAYPQNAEKLKQVIHDELKKKYGSDIPVDFLADKIEIIDEEWHNAVEGYLNTQRMNIIVPPDGI